MNLPMKKLADVCSFIDYRGKTPQKQSSGIPLITAKNVADRCLDFTVKEYISENDYEGWMTRGIPSEDDVLFTTEAPLGKVSLLGTSEKIALAQRLLAIRCNQNILYPRYLMYSISFPIVWGQIIQRSSGSTVKGIRSKELRLVKIPLPPLETQKRIVALLDKAQELIDKRKEQITLMDQLIQSLFYDIFSGKDFSELNVVELVKDPKKSIRSGPFGSALKHSEFTTEGIAVLGIDNAVNNKFAWKQRRYISERKYSQLKRYTVFPDDVIITIMGTTGRIAVVPKTIPTAITTKHLASITLNQDLILPTYFSHCLLSHPSVRQQLHSQKKGAIMDGLNLGIIKSLNLPVPPLSLQKQYVERVDNIESQTNVMNTSLKELEDNFNSLMQRAFKGEL